MSNTNSKVIIGIIVVAVLIVGGWFILNSQQKSSTSSSPSPSPATTPPSATNAPATATITYTGSGFSPSSVILKSGGKLTITNSSSSGMQFNSNPHPLHTDNPELNVGAISSGQSMTVTLTTKGTWGYHNHLSPDQTGTIIVQ